MYTTIITITLLASILSLYLVGIEYLYRLIVKNKDDDIRRKRDTQNKY